MKNTVTIFLIMLSIYCKAQEHGLDEINAAYQPVLEHLSNPDTLYIYEVYSSGRHSLAYYIGVNDKNISAGYYLSPDFFTSLLLPRNLMSKDSIGKVFRFVEENSRDFRSILSFIENYNILDHSMNKANCNKDNIDDGDIYQLTRITKKELKSIRYYELNDIVVNCPNDVALQNFFKIDKLYKTKFRNRSFWEKKIISEYKMRAHYQ